MRQDILSLRKRTAFAGLLLLSAVAAIADWTVVNLNPAGASLSVASGMQGGQQVGLTMVGGVERASLWSGTAAPWVDLHAFLSPEFTSSGAADIWIDGTSTYAVGTGLNSATGRNEKLMRVWRPDVSLVSWGYDDFGAVSETPSGTDFVDVDGGGLHSVALRSDGSLVSWGNDDFGQVGGTPAGTGFVAVAGGHGHSVALRSDGSLVSWGDDFNGQVGGTPAGTGFRAAAAGGYHSVALRSDGSLVSWGWDLEGQVSGTPAGTGFVAVAGGYEHSVAIRSDGSLVSWGFDSRGQVSGTPAGTGFVAVAGGHSHSVALRSDGSLVSWGFDSNDQIRGTPAGTGFVAVAGGYKHSVALRADGSLVSWGADSDGLVSGTPAGTGFAAVAAGGYHSVAIRTSQPNGPPVAPNDSYSTSEDTSLSVAAPGVLGNDTDPDSDPLTAELVTSPRHGVLVLDPNGSFTYTPDGNYNGSESFTYRASDGSAYSNTATVKINITPVNDPPDAANDTDYTFLNTAVTIVVLYNDADIDGDPLTVTGVMQPANGTATIDAGGTVTYTPRNGFTGIDTFTYTISDGAGGTDMATVTIDVSRPNRPPRARNDDLDTNPDTPVTLDPLVNDDDPDGDTLTLVSITQPSNGSAVINGDGTVTYTPAAGFSGNDTFTYTISDGRGGMDVGRIRVRVRWAHQGTRSMPTC